MAWQTIKREFVNPYLSLQTEEEREQFINEHPETPEVMQIMSEIYSKHIERSKKERALAELIRQDIEKRKTLQEAKKLERQYEQQLSQKELRTTKPKE